MVKYPVGYRFLPTDEELITEYLVKKINDQPIPIDIAVVNFNDNNPDMLSGAYPPLVENEWYFFTLRNRKYENGSRPDRTTPGGFWKATVADKPVTDSDGVIVGSKRSLKFFEGTPSNKPIKTDWIMHEFMAAANQPSRNKRDANGNMKMDDLVLCRIHKKTAKSDDNNRGLPSDHDQCLHLSPLPAPDVDLSSEFAISEQRRRVIEVLMAEDEQEPEGVSPLEVAAEVEYWRKVLEGSLTEEEEPAGQEPPHGVLPLDHLPENRDVPPDDRLDLPLPAPGLPSSRSELTAEEVYHWTNFMERLRKEAQEPNNVAESSHGVSSYEFLGDEDYYGTTSALKGVPTEEEEQQQNYIGMSSSSPRQKRAGHFDDQ